LVSGEISGHAGIYIRQFPMLLLHAFKEPYVL